MTALTGAELVAELRRIAELVPTSDAGVAMLAAAQQFELVREWADRYADRETGTEFEEGYRRGAEWARWMLGGPHPVIRHEGSDWPELVDWRTRNPHDRPAWMQPGDLLNGRRVRLRGDADVTAVPDAPRGWADPASTPLADLQEWNRRTEEAGEDLRTMREQIMAGPLVFMIREGDPRPAWMLPGDMWQQVSAEAWDALRPESQAAFRNPRAALEQSHPGEVATVETSEFTEWAVEFDGGTAFVSDDRADVEDWVQWIIGGVLVRRDVTQSEWYPATPPQNGEDHG